MLQIQKYLKEKSYDDLEKEFGIKSNVYDDRVVLNYSQINSPKRELIVKECRGLILSIPDHNILCRSFDRFFNYGEDPHTNKFDISKAVVDDKIDGSLCNVYFDGVKWQVSTRQMAFAEGKTITGRTFRELFIEALGGDPDIVFNSIDHNLTIIFELTSPETRIVTPYDDIMLYLLDVRDRESGTFYGNVFTYFWTIPKGIKWRYPKKYKFENIQNCIDAAKNLPALDEGYIANIDGWRLKIKNPSYLAIANLRMNGEINEKRVIKLVFMNDHIEYLGYFPEDQEIFDPYIKAYRKMILDINKHWIEHKDIDSQSDFAHAIKNCHAKNILFGMRNKGLTIEESIENMTDNTKVRLIKGYVRS